VRVDPLTAIVLLVVAGAGFGAGWGLRPNADTEEILHAHSQSLDAVLDGQTELLTEVNRPVVIDAELRSTLAEVPVQCRTDAGGDPASVQCQWATCLQYGQSNAQRPECRAIEELLVKKLGEGCE
jgi:hypothetical protein